MTENRELGMSSAAPEKVPGPAPAIWQLMDMELPIRISLGKTEMPLHEVLRLTTGSIIELNRSVGDPVDIVVNEHLIARGEVVVVNGNYGVRIQHLAGAPERKGNITPASAAVRLAADDAAADGDAQ